MHVKTLNINEYTLNYRMLGHLWKFISVYTPFFKNICAIQITNNSSPMAMWLCIEHFHTTICIAATLVSQTKEIINFLGWEYPNMTAMTSGENALFCSCSGIHSSLNNYKYQNEHRNSWKINLDLKSSWFITLFSGF